MKPLHRFYPESRFGGFTDIDGTIAFFSRVNALIEPESVVVDFGCGRGEYQDDPIGFRRQLRILKDKAGRVIGLDVDPAGEENPFLDEFQSLKNQQWPLEDDSADMVVCDNVMEHLPQPEAFFREARRVLRHGGMLCVRTPNLWSYISLASRLIPNRYHGKVLESVQVERQQEDVFPTLYRCNTTGRMRSEMRKAGFAPVVYCYEAEPSYLSFSPIAYAFGVLHQRLAPRAIKPVIFAFGRAHG